MECYVGAATILDFMEIFFEGWGWLVQLFEIVEHVFVLWFFFANSFVVFLEQVWNAQVFVLRFICNMSFVLCLKEFGYKKLQKAMVWYIMLFCVFIYIGYPISVNYYNLWVVLYDSLRNVMLGLSLFWILWEFFLKLGVG